MILLLLLYSISSFAQNQWQPDIETLSGKIELIRSINQRHEGIIRENLSFKRNFIDIYNNANSVINRLGQNSNSTYFNSETRIINHSYRTGSISYNEQALIDVKNQLSSDFRKFPFTELTSLRKDLENFKERVKVHLKMNQISFNSKTYNTQINRFFRLAPLLYDEYGNPKYRGTLLNHATTLFRVFNELKRGDIEDIYFDYWSETIRPQIKEITHLETLTNSNKVIQRNIGIWNHSLKFEKSFINRVVTKALTPKSSSNTKTRKRYLSLEEIPSLVGVIRGCIGNDCSATSVPFFPLVKGTKVLWIRKSNSIETKPDGYLLYTMIDYKEKRVPYIITINGRTLNKNDIEHSVYLLSKLTDQDQLILPNFKKATNIVNRDIIKNTLNKYSAHRSAINIDLPSGWNEAQEDGYSYYRSNRLSFAYLIDSSNSRIAAESVETKIDTVKSEYVRPNSINNMSRFERSILANQVTDGSRSTPNSGPTVRKLLNVNQVDIQTSSIIYNASTLNPLNIDDYSLVKKHFNLDDNILMSLDLLTRAHSLATLSKEKNKIDNNLMEKISQSTFKDLNHQIQLLISNETDEEDIYRNSLNALMAIPYISDDQRIDSLVRINASQLPSVKKVTSQAINSIPKGEEYINSKRKKLIFSNDPSDINSALKFYSFSAKPNEQEENIIAKHISSGDKQIRESYLHLLEDSPILTLKQQKSLKMDIVGYLYHSQKIFLSKYNIGTAKNSELWPHSITQRFHEVFKQSDIKIQIKLFPIISMKNDWPPYIYSWLNKNLHQLDNYSFQYAISGATSMGRIPDKHLIEKISEVVVDQIERYRVDVTSSIKLLTKTQHLPEFLIYSIQHFINQGNWNLAENIAISHRLPDSFFELLIAEQDQLLTSQSYNAQRKKLYSLLSKTQWPQDFYEHFLNSLTNHTSKNLKIKFELMIQTDIFWKNWMRYKKRDKKITSKQKRIYKKFENKVPQVHYKLTHYPEYYWTFITREFSTTNANDLLISISQQSEWSRHFTFKIESMLKSNIESDISRALDLLEKTKLKEIPSIIVDALSSLNDADNKILKGRAEQIIQKKVLPNKAGNKCHNLLLQITSEAS